jgi:hypothetical protein
MTIAVVTTLPDHSWDIYGKRMVQSFTQYWPKEIPILIQLDDDLLAPQVSQMARPQDAIGVGWRKEHKEFVERNKGKDHPDNYRQQPVRFCHKIFAIGLAYDTLIQQKKDGLDSVRYLIWMDADVITQRQVTLQEIEACLPKDAAASTLQRKDWPHSECGWIAFDLENGGDKIIQELVKAYSSDRILEQEQQHDSWMFDIIVKELDLKVTNLTPNAPGLDVWQFSPMGQWSIHYKGPQAKANLAMQKIPQQARQGNIVIQTQNSIPNEDICRQIEENQEMIKNWVKSCVPTDEEIVIVSAGPTLVAEDVRKEVAAGKKIVAVKNALERLKAAGIKPWATILLDPRPHVLDFVNDPDTDIIWFVASQVNPKVVRRLLGAGCTVYGYHAAVGAGEHELTAKQAYAVISGGSATATRGMFVLNHLGFKKFKLYGYDLSFPDKPNLDERDERGQPKYLEFSLTYDERFVSAKRCFWTEPQLYAQLLEMKSLIDANTFELDAEGEGMIPFMIKHKKLSHLRNREQIAKMTGNKTITYKELLKCKTQNSVIQRLLKWWHKTPRRLSRASNY